MALCLGVAVWIEVHTPSNYKPDVIAQGAATLAPRHTNVLEATAASPCAQQHGPPHPRRTVMQLQWE